MDNLPHISDLGFTHLYNGNNTTICPSMLGILEEHWSLIEWQILYSHTFLSYCSKNKHALWLQFKFFSLILKMHTLHFFRTQTASFNGKPAANWHFSCTLPQFRGIKWNPVCSQCQIPCLFWVPLYSLLSSSYHAKQVLSVFLVQGPLPRCRRGRASLAPPKLWMEAKLVAARANPCRVPDPLNKGISKSGITSQGHSL